MRCWNLTALYKEFPNFEEFWVYWIIFLSRTKEIHMKVHGKRPNLAQFCKMWYDSAIWYNLRGVSLFGKNGKKQKWNISLWKMQINIKEEAQ